METQKPAIGLQGQRVQHNGGKSNSARKGQYGTVRSVDALSACVKWEKGGQTTEWKSSLDIVT